MRPMTAAEAAVRHAMLKQIVARARARNEEHRQHQDAYAAYRREVTQRVRALFRGQDGGTRG